MIRMRAHPGSSAGAGTMTVLVVLLLLSGCAASQNTAPTPRVGDAIPSAEPAPEPLSAQPPSSSSETWRYALVIDASSSGTGLQIFQWRPREGRLPQIEAAPFPRATDQEVWEVKVRPGLSAYAQTPDEVVNSIRPLIDYAIDQIGSDPAVLSQTSLLLRATAGMRLLPADRQEEVMSRIRDYFSRLPFDATSAQIISGDDEGVFGWLSVNYVLGHLEHGGPFPTVGALDLGGASTQITFVPLDYPKSGGRTITVGDNTYHLYTHSYLGLGQDQARETVNSPACFLRGYTMPGGNVGTGDFDSCRRAIRLEFAASCSTPPCSLFGVYQPAHYGDFLAFSVYAYAADFFDLNQQLIPESLADNVRAFCSKDWSEMVAADPALADNPYVPNYCYAGAHIVTLLTDGFGFPAETEKVTAPLRVQGSSVGWTLGALIHELAGR